MENQEQVNLPDIIRDRKILPFEIKKSIRNRIFFNCIMFIIMLLITLIINISFNKMPIRIFDNYIDVVQVCLALISIGVLEVAYRKDSETIGLYGIELLVYSISVLFVPYMYISKQNINFLKNVIIGFAIYYFVKSIVTYLYIKYSYLRDNISDIKELVKEEKEGYLDEKSEKTLKMQKIKAEKSLEKKSKKEKSNIDSKKTIEKTKKKSLKLSGGNKNDK